MKRARVRVSTSQLEPEKRKQVMKQLRERRTLASMLAAATDEEVDDLVDQIASGRMFMDAVVHILYARVRGRRRGGK